MNIPCLTRKLIQIGVFALVLSTLFILSATSAYADSPDDFDDQILEVMHVTDDSTGCLDVKHGNASDGQDVWTWECNKTDAQKWKFEKRTSGAYAGSYRLVSTIGNDTHCLDNRGDFTTSDRMGVWTCVSDSHGAAPNQSVTIAESGDGYTITFVRNSDSKSVWLVTDRDDDNPKGGANQTTVTDTVPASAVWRIGSASLPPTPTPTPIPPAQDPPANADAEGEDDDDDDIQPENVDTDADPYDGKTFFLRHPGGSAVDCLEVPSSTVTTRLETGECDYNDNEKWVLQKRTSGEWAGSYRMAHKPTIGTNRVLCAVMSADYTSIDTNVKLGRCRDDNDGRADYQTFTVENVAGGYAIRFATDHPYMHFYYTRLGVTKDDDNNDDVATIPAGTARNGIVAPTAAVTWELLEGEPAEDFDDQVVQIYHVTDDSTGCLAVPEVKFGSYTQRAGAQLTTAACDESAGQQWQLEKQTGDKYLLRSMLYSQVYCLDNDAQFTTSDRMGVEPCAVNDNGYGSSALVDQTVEIEAEGNGYTLTFTSGSNSSWLSTSRADNSASGPVGQTAVVVEDPVRASAVWGIGTVEDRKAGRTNPTLVKPVDLYHGKVVKIKTRHDSGTGWTAGCLYTYGSKSDPNVALLMSSLPTCHWHQTATYSDMAASTSWRIEMRTSGDFAGSYRLVNMVGGQNLCADADVDDKYDSGNEFKTTPDTATAGMFVDTCVGDDHAEVASQSVAITKLSNTGAWGKDTYTIAFVESAADDATEVYLSAKSLLGYAGQRVATQTVHEFSTLYLEEQVVPMDSPPK